MASRTFPSRALDHSAHWNVLQRSAPDGVAHVHVARALHVLEHRNPLRRGLGRHVPAEDWVTEEGRVLPGVCREAVARKLERNRPLLLVDGRRAAAAQWACSVEGEYRSTGEVWQAVRVGKAPGTPNNPILSGGADGQISRLFLGVVCHTLAVRATTQHPRCRKRHVFHTDHREHGGYRQRGHHRQPGDPAACRAQRAWRPQTAW